jgi:hypothetical protein
MYISLLEIISIKDDGNAPGCQADGEARVGAWRDALREAFK